MKLKSFGKIATKERVDKGAGVIYGVSVVTAGPALGHDLIFDEKSLGQVITCAKEYADGLKVRLNHPGKEGAQVQSIVGALKNFRKDATQVRADLFLLKSDENFDKIIELAETQPENFGLSIVISGKPEQDEDIKLARITEIYACDLVDDPAANPTGLFSKKETSMTKAKYKNGKDGAHADDCECMKCGGNDDEKDTKMSALYDALELGADADADEFFAALAAKIKPAKVEMPDMTPLDTRLKALETAGAVAIAMAQKTEIEALRAEAARDGKIIPFDQDDLYTVADGNVTIKMLPSALSKMISKLPAQQLKLSTRKMEPVKGADNKPVDRRSREGAETVREWCLAKQEENARAFATDMKAQRQAAN